MNDKSGERIARGSIGSEAMPNRPARYRGLRFTPRPEPLEERRFLTGVLQPHLDARPSDLPSGEVSPGLRGGLHGVTERDRIESRAMAWQTGAPIPLARTEVAAGVVADEIIVVGGFLQDGSSSS